MVKVEFWEDEKLGQLSRDARLLFIGTWNMADDGGNVKLTPVWLRSRLFPFDDDVTPKQLEEWLGELIDAGRIVPYEVQGERYGSIVHFLDHQYINHPSKRRNPVPLTEDSGSTTVGIPVELRTPNSEVKRTPNSESTTGALPELSAIAAENGATQHQGTDIARLVREAAINGDVVEALQAATFLEQHIDHDYLEDWLRAAAKLPDRPKHVSGVVELVRSRAARHKNPMPAYRVKSPIRDSEDW